MSRTNRFFSLFNRKKLFLFICIMLLVGFFYSYPITFTQKIVDELSNLSRFPVILVYICSYMACRILGCIFDYLGGVFSKTIANDMNENLRRKFLVHYYEVHPEQIYNEKFEKIYAIYDNDISILANGVCGPLLWFLSSVSLFLWSSVTLGRIRWELMLIYMAGAMIIVSITVDSGKRVGKMQNTLREKEENRIFLAKTAFEQYLTFLVTRREGDLIQQNVYAEQEYNLWTLKESRISLRKTLMNDIVYYLAGAFVWLAGCWFISADDMTTGELVAFISYAGLIISPIVRFSSQWIAIQKMKVSWRRVSGFLNLPAAAWGNLGVDAMREASIALGHVTFSYVKKETIIEDLSCSLEAGRLYCLSGENGSGKSTLLKLICRVIDSYDGSIRINGNNIRDYSKEALYAEIAYENESPFIMKGSILENLTFGNGQVSLDEVQDLYEKTGLAASLGEQYTLEYVLEKGDKQLSSGQKQMIGIIRNLLSHKKILILDESFSGIANSLVAEIFDLYRVYCRNNHSMLIYVSHNKEHQKYADESLKLDNGKLISDKCID